MKISILSMRFFHLAFALHLKKKKKKNLYIYIYIYIKKIKKNKNVIALADTLQGIVGAERGGLPGALCDSWHS